MERMTASEQIFRTLRGKILSTVLQPGQMLNVQTLADELGVSRSPVRDALLKLREERLVELEKGFLRPTRAGMAVADSLALI